MNKKPDELKRSNDPGETETDDSTQAGAGTGAVSQGE